MRRSWLIYDKTCSRAWPRDCSSREINQLRVRSILVPTMLQFLQCKTFGSHRIPEGWIIVTAAATAGVQQVRLLEVPTW